MKEATLGRGFDVILLNEFNSLSSDDARLIYTIAALAYMHGAPVRRRHLGACVDRSDIAIARLFREDLREIVVPWGESTDLVSPRHRRIALHVATQDAPVTLRSEGITRYLIQVSVEITPHNISRRTPEYIAYRSMINLDNLFELFGEDYDTIIQVFDSLKTYYSEDFLFWLQYGRAELHFDNFNEAENYLKQSLSIRDGVKNYQAMHHMGVLHLRRARFLDDSNLALASANVGENILAEQIGIRGDDDPYPYAALITHKLKYLRRHGSPHYAGDIEALYGLAKDGLRKHRFSSMMGEAHQEIYREYLMIAVTGGRPAAGLQTELPFGAAQTTAHDEAF
jgi:hypothetical protein